MSGTTYQFVSVDKDLGDKIRFYKDLGYHIIDVYYTGHNGDRDIKGAVPGTPGFLLYMLDSE